MTPTPPKISVITVCFNSAATIEAALQSVAAQSWPAIEHIVIDGGSTDDTLRIVDQNSHRLTAVVSEPDKGIYDAMNKGLRRATGDYVAFLNSDDVYARGDVIARIAEVIAVDSPDAVYGDVEFVHPDRPERVVRYYSSAKFRPERLGSGLMMAHPSLFLRLSLFEEHGYFDDSYRIAGDFELVARIFSSGAVRCRYIAEPLVRMNLGGASTSGIRALLQINREIMRACRANHIKTNWLRLLSRYPAKGLEYVRR